MTAMTISIITVCLNAEAHIEKCLHSITSKLQDEDENEYIVNDDEYYIFSVRLIQENNVQQVSLNKGA